MILPPSDCARLGARLHSLIDRAADESIREDAELRALADDMEQAASDLPGADVARYFERKRDACTDPAARDWLTRFLGNVRKACAM